MENDCPTGNFEAEEEAERLVLNSNRFYHLLSMLMILFSLFMDRQMCNTTQLDVAVVTGSCSADGDDHRERHADATGTARQPFAHKPFGPK